MVFFHLFHFNPRQTARAEMTLTLYSKLYCLLITATDNCHFQGYDLTTRYDLLVIYKSQTNYLPNVLTIIMRVADSLFILQT